MKKRLTVEIAVILLIALFLVFPVKASVTITLDSSQSVSEQVNALKMFIEQLPQDAQNEWRSELKVLSLDEVVYFAEIPPGSEDMTVYISGSGAKYHMHINCRGLTGAMTISKVIKEVALEMDRTPCKICYPYGDSE